jgi:hypothetical protein
LNSTIPVKIELSGASAGTSDAVITQSVGKLRDNVWGDGLEGTSTATPPSGSQLRYDATNDQYIFNLATRPLGTGTFRVTLDLGGGKTEAAQFRSSSPGTSMARAAPLEPPLPFTPHRRGPPTLQDLGATDGPCASNPSTEDEALVRDVVAHAAAQPAAGGQQCGHPGRGPHCRKRRDETCRWPQRAFVTRPGPRRDPRFGGLL